MTSSTFSFFKKYNCVCSCQAARNDRIADADVSRWVGAGIISQAQPNCTLQVLGRNKLAMSGLSLETVACMGLMSVFTGADRSVSGSVVLSVERTPSRCCASRVTFYIPAQSASGTQMAATAPRVPSVAVA